MIPLLAQDSGSGLPEFPKPPANLDPIGWVAVALVTLMIVLQLLRERSASKQRDALGEKLEGAVDRMEASRELETADRALLIQALREKAEADAALAAECHAGQAKNAEALHAFDNAMRSFERVAQDLKNVSENLRANCVAHRQVERMALDETPEEEVSP